MSEEVRSNSQWSRLAAGIIILFAGVIFWLDQIDQLDATDYLDWWPFALVAIGLGQMAERRWSAGLLWMAIGGFFLLPLLGYDRPSFRELFGLFPLFFSIAGLTLIVQALRTPSQRIIDGFSAVAVMAGNVRRVASPSPGGHVVAVMGGCQIDVAPTALQGSEITIDVLAFWGGVEVIIPRGWNVADYVAPILGGVENKAVHGTEGAPRVVLRGSVIMGGVEIRNSAETVV